MAIAVNDIIRITCGFQWAAQDFFSNTMYFKIITNGTADDDDWMDSIATFLNTAYLELDEHQASTFNYIDIRGQNITQDVILPTKSWPTLTIGGDTGQGLPTQVAALVYYRTLKPNIRCGVYIAGLGELVSLSGGALAAALITSLENFGDDFLGTISPVNTTLNYGAYNPEFDRFTPVDSRVIPVRFRTQRRRRLNVGS